jgi:asparagine synthase (glutamine-hydrolysing)
MNTNAELTWETSKMGLRAEILHWDGRLDNRNDLLLLLRHRLEDDRSNAAIVRATFERYGIEGFVRLIGDWSVVIRDHANRAIVLASDFAGVRPLYYHVRPDRVFWSSHLQSIVDDIGATELDEHYVRGFLLLGGCPNRTPYKDIYPVPSGHAVILSSQGTTIRRFWNLPIGDEIRYRTERQYEEHLRDLFREAVAVRLQTESPVLAELSGGLDSSSVVSMANHLIRGGAAKASHLTGVSYVWRNSLDEPFIREVESSCGIKSVHLSTHDIPLISESSLGNAAPEIFHPIHSAVGAVARGLNAKVILTGLNGDLVMGNCFDDSHQVAASLRRFRLRRACEEALAWSKILRLPVYSIVWRAFRAALPSSLASAEVYSVADGSFTPKSSDTSLLAAFGDRTSDSESSHIFSDVWMQAQPERRKHFRCLSSLLEMRALQAPEPLQHLDYTHPFAHRPLVEFLMAVPPDILCRPGEPRRLMRSALADLWPAKLHARRSKGLFNAPWQEALKPLACVLLNTGHLHLAERGFVDRSSVLPRLQRLSVGLDCNESQLRQIILLELWLRNRADRRVSGHRPRAA